VGSDGLSAHQHGRRPALRKIRRSLRPQDRPASGDRGVSRGLRAVRHRAEHAAADHVSRARRPGRRRTDRHHHRRDRRPHPAARARALSGLLRRGVRSGHHRRPASRRLLRRSSELALDFLHQPADRNPRAGGDRRRAAVALDAPPARGRLRGRAPAHRRAQRRHPVHRARRHDLSLDFAGRDRPDGGEHRRRHRLHRRRDAGARADPADESVRQPQFRGRERRRPDRRALAVRRGDVPADLSSGGEGRIALDLGPAAHADDARHAGDLGDQRPPDQPLRPLQAVPRPRHRDHDVRARRAVAARDRER